LPHSRAEIPTPSGVVIRHCRRDGQRLANRGDDCFASGIVRLVVDPLQGRRGPLPRRAGAASEKPIEGRHKIQFFFGLQRC
jgi:hypothetical protein